MKASRAWVMAALAPLIALLVTRPWTRAAFPVWDYAELLPILRKADGFWQALAALAEFNRADGRANYLAYAQFALSWELAGDNPVLWQWQRAAVMLVAALLLVAVARRFGASPLAAGLGALLFTLSVPGTEGWLFLMGEPLAVLLLLLLLLACAGYRSAERWRLRGLLIAGLVLGVMLTKEVLGVLLPVTLLLGFCLAPGEGFRRPVLGPRERWLIGCLGVVLALEVWSVRAALGDAAPGGYASGFASGGLELGRVGTLFQAMLLPARFVTAGIGTLLYPANLAFLLVLLLGAARPTEGQRPAGWGWWVAGLLAYPLIGALTYGLWPRYSAFYGIPFFAGAVGLFILAGTGLERSHRIGRWLLLGLGAAAILTGGVVAERVIAEKRALSDLAVRVVRSFPERPRLDTLLVVAPPGGRRWPVTALELARYAVAIGVPGTALPRITRDAPCAEVAGRLALPLGRTGVLNDQNPCGRLPARTAVWEAEVRYRDWLTLGGRRDTVRLELLAPAWR